MHLLAHRPALCGHRLVARVALVRILDAYEDRQVLAIANRPPTLIRGAVYGGVVAPPTLGPLVTLARNLVLSSSHEQIIVLVAIVVTLPGPLFY